MFTPDDQRGGGEGGGRKGVIVVEVIGIEIPVFQSHRGPGGPWVLLLSKNPNHHCSNTSSKGCLSEKAVLALTQVLIESKEKVVNAFEKAATTDSRQALKTGAEDYIKALADIVQIIICEKFKVDVVQSK